MPLPLLFRAYRLALVIVCSSATAIFAGTIDKANNSDALNLGASWLGGTPPTSADIAQWSATVTGVNNVSLGANTNWLGLKLINPSGAVTLTAGNTLTLGGSGIDLSSATRDLALNCAVALHADQTWNIASGRSVTVGGGVAGSGFVLTRSGAGTNVFGGGAVTLKTLNVTGAVARVTAGSVSVTGGAGDYGYAVVAGGGRFEQTGGTFSSPGYFTVGRSPGGGAPVADVSGGTLSAGAEFLIGYGANGFLNLSGAGTINAGAKLRLGQSGNATVNLNGGTLIAREFGTGGTSASIVNLNGGCLRPGTSPVSPWWPNLAGVTATVKSGGVWFDDGGLNVTVQQPLLDGTGGGGLRKSGAGSLNLTATNTYSGPTVISNGTLNVNGRLNGPGAVTVKSGATLGGTGTVAGAVTVENGATIAVATGDLEIGALILNSSSLLKLALSPANTGTNAPLRVNGNLMLDGSLTVLDAGLVAGSNVTAIYHTGTLVNNGLTVDARSEWNCTVDTSTPNFVKLQVGAKYPLIECTNGNFAVRTTSTNLGGVLHGYPALPIWYEVRDATNRLWDYGSAPANSPWSVTVRHLRPGTNTVTFFAKSAGGVIESNAVQLAFSPGTNPPVRPRPQPAEVWWGGTSHDNLYSGPSITGTYSRMEQLTNTGGWDYVKRFQDGFLLHGYVWVNNAARMTNWLTVGPAISAQLVPFNAKYWLENAWRPEAGNIGYGSNSVSGQVADANDMLGVGFALSEVTQDYNPMWYDFSSWQPAWPTNDLRVAGTGNTNTASPSYPFVSGQWRDFATGFKAARPGIKFGWTWSPVYFHWQTGPAIRDDGNFSITNGPSVYSFNWDFCDWMADAVLIGNQVGVSFAFASDCPWGWYGSWGNPTVAANNRKKIRAYEAWLQGQGLRHTLICNDATDTNLWSNPDLFDTTFKNNSLKNLFLHQQEGGRAARYLFESWYRGPFTVLPETKPGSYANLALEAIKFIKGIADTNGNLESLSLTLLTTGAVTTVRLQNNGSAACLPAVLAFESGNPATSIQYSNAAGSNITAQILSAEGYAHTNLLSPGQSTIITIAVQGAAPAQSKTVTLETFWNPQDPGGFVRDRLSIALPVIFGATNTFTWTNNASGNWSTPANWSNSVAPMAGGSENNTLRFLGGGYTASNNLVGPFALNKLELTSTTGGALSGGPLRFAATAPGGVAPQLNQTAAGAFTVANPLLLDAELTLGGSGAGGVSLSGDISGAGGFTKSGTATVTLAGSNTFTGVTRVTSGTLVIGDGTNNSSISILTTNSGALRFVTATNTAQTHSGTIHGPGALQKQGSGTLVLGAANTFSGVINLGAQNVNGGALRMVHGGALGTTGSQTFIGGGSSDARLEVLGNLTVPESLTLAQNNGPVVHVLNVADTNTLTGNVTLNGGGNTWTLQSDAGRILFTGNFTNTASGFTRPLQLQGEGDGELTGVLADNSLNWLQIRKAGAGTWTISGPATLPQGVQVSEGTLLVNGVIGTGANTGVSVVNGGTFGGNGQLAGPVTVQAGATLAPGTGGIGTLTLLSDLTFSADSVCVMEISKAGLTNDRVQGLQTVNFGGTLLLTNLAGDLSPGDSFQLFSATIRQGAFAALHLPPLNPAFTWTNRLLLDGSLAVVALPVAPPLLLFTMTPSNTLLFSWTNHTVGFKLQSQTNPLSVGLGGAWFDFPGGDNPPVSVPLDRAPGSVMFRLNTP